MTLVHKLPEFEYDGTKGFRPWLRAVTVNKWRELTRKKTFLTNQVQLPELESPLDDEFWEIEHRQFLVRRCLEAVRGDFQLETWQACWSTVVNDLTGHRRWTGIAPHSRSGACREISSVGRMTENRVRRHAGSMPVPHIGATPCWTILRSGTMETHATSLLRCRVRCADHSRILAASRIRSAQRTLLT